MNIDISFEDPNILSEHRLSSGYVWTNPHIHQTYEICMALGEGFTYFVNNRLYTLDHGDVMLITNTDVHKTIMPLDRPYERQVISFSPETLSLDKKKREELLTCFVHREKIDGRKLVLTEAEQKEFLRLAQDISDESRKTFMREIGQELTLCRLLLQLNRIWERTSKHPVVEKDDYPRHIRLVFEYIMNNYSHNITLDELSASCYLNKHYLCRLFRRETGLSIHNCITSYRLTRAIVLLREGKSVKDVSWLSGFNSTSHFISTFKKNTGMTPLQFLQRGTPESNSVNEESTAQKAWD